MEVIHEAIDDALSAAGVEQGEVHRICCGLAGVDAAGLRDRLQWGLEKIFGYGRIQLTSDAQIALAGATDGPVDSPAAYPPEIGAVRIAIAADAGPYPA